MEKSGFLGQASYRKSLRVFALSTVLVTSFIVDGLFGQVGPADKEKVLGRVGREWIAIGQEYYRRDHFLSAEQSFLTAQDYQAYLSAAEKDKLGKLLENTHIAVFERQSVLKLIEDTNKLSKQGQLIKAKERLEKARGSKFLSKAEQKRIGEELSRLSSQLSEQRRRISELYSRSVGYYRTNQLEKARQGFLEVAKSNLLSPAVGKTAEEYLQKIDAILLERLGGLSRHRAAEQERLPKSAVGDIEQELVDIEPITEQGTGAIDRKRSILRSYTSALVNDTSERIENYLQQDKIAAARQAVAMAEQIVNKNRPYLGEQLFGRYSSQLKRLSLKITEAREVKQPHR